MSTLNLPVLHWRKSSRSNDYGNCIEVALLPANWRKSSHSIHNGACVEVASGHGAVAARDSKNPDGPVLIFDRTTWTTFLHSL